MRIFPIMRPVLLPIVDQNGLFQTSDIEAPIPIRFSPADKLIVLRRLDRGGGWVSLDDHRFCRRCEHVFSGRQIDIVGGTREHGRLRLLCPSEGCISTCEDWVRVVANEKQDRVSHNGHVVRVVRTRGQVVAESDSSPPVGIELGATFKKVRSLLRPLRATSRA
jgi:hypothetical protein